MSTSRPLPGHAYHFSMALFLATTAGVNRYLSGDPEVSTLCGKYTLGFLVLGIDSLHREHRLDNVIASLTDVKATLWNKISNLENVTDDLLPALGSKLKR